MLRDRTRLLTGAVVCTAALGWLAACASNPVPDEKIAVAKAEVARAEQSGAPTLAPVELAAARDKLQRAEKAAADHDAAPATALAEQANVDAQVAEATAQEQRSHQAAMQLDASLQALRQEAMRNTAPPPSSASPPPTSASPPPTAQ